MAEDMMDKTVNAIMTAFIAVILIASAFIPTAISQIDTLSNLNVSSAMKGVLTGYTGLLGVVVTITILGVVIGVLKTYNLTRFGRGDEGER